MPQQYETLSFGVLMVIIALMLVALVAGIITDPYQMIALIIAFYGIWTLVLAGIRTRNPEKYGRGAGSTMAMGIVLLAIGGAWFLLTIGTNPVLALALLLIIVGILAVVSALPSLRQKPK